jgi:hypothetical protein
MLLPTLISYLSTALITDAGTSEENEVFVGVEAPSEYTGYVLVDQTGSSTSNHITTTTVAIQSYGATLYEALLLNEQVKAAMVGFAEKSEISSVKLETDYNFTNTATKQYRWQAVYHITHYLGGI